MTNVLFSVRCYEGADGPQDGFQTVEADSAKEAAEKLCGEPLTELGPNLRLRAMVLSKPPRNRPLTFYATG